MVKFKEVGVSNPDNIKSGDVVKLVQDALGDPKILRGKKSVNKFNLDTHARCWKKYSVRPDSKSKQPHVTKGEFCIYDKPHKDYLYTPRWVAFLSEKIKDEEEYKSLYPSKA